MSVHIRENFLHYLWKHKLFKNDNLIASTGESLQIVKVGLHNRDSGPDFFNSQIKINGQLWAGNVEIHLKSSDWYAHQHETDTAYDSVILHVVWENDAPIYSKSNVLITTLVLKNYVPATILKNYFDLFSASKELLNCENEIHNMDSFAFQNWKERLYFERLESKSVFIMQLLKESKNDWEAVLFKMLAKNFGLKVNGEAFLQMANSIEFSVIRKLRRNPKQLEALFFGQLSMLKPTVENRYYKSLKSEFTFLKNKFSLDNNLLTEAKFFRLRPNNFPTIRLSQLASFYNEHDNLFSKLMKLNNLSDIYLLFQVHASEFWDTHYSFEATSVKRKKNITKAFVDLLLVNTIIPIKLAYYNYLGIINENEIIEMINQIKPERNRIISMYAKLGVKAKNALDSQALLQLKNNYCISNRCLECVVGSTFMQK